MTQARGNSGTACSIIDAIRGEEPGSNPHYSYGGIILNSSVNHSIVQEMVGRVISNAGHKAGGGLLFRPAISEESYGAEETYS